MRPKKAITSTFFVLITTMAFSQLKVDQYGRIGMGTNYPNPGYKLHVKGNLLLTTYPEIPPPNTVPVELRFKVGNGWPGAEIGTNVRNIAFWSAEVGYNDLYAQNLILFSDSILKKNITQLNNSYSLIKQLNGYKYQFKSVQDTSLNRSSIKDERYSYGVLAQEIENILPNLVYEVNGVKAVNYIGLIPIIIEGMKEQQKAIETASKKIDSLSNILNQYSIQNQKIESLTNIVNQCCSKNQQPLYNNTGNAPQLDFNFKGRLYQNIPNPFNDETRIEYELNENTQSAAIIVFDLQGNFKKSYPINSKASGSIIIKSGEFNQGIYIYSLIIDNQEIDSKRMILIE